MSCHYRSVKEKVEKGQNRNCNLNKRQCTWKFLRTEIKCYLVKLSSNYHSDNLFSEISENLLNTGILCEVYGVSSKQFDSLIFDCLKHSSAKFLKNVK